LKWRNDARIIAHGLAEDPGEADALIREAEEEEA
jgi:hypothetical protein